jgi:hypothetical protein
MGLVTLASVRWLGLVWAIAGWKRLFLLSFLLRGACFGLILLHFLIF